MTDWDDRYGFLPEAVDEVLEAEDAVRMSPPLRRWFLGEMGEAEALALGYLPPSDAA